MLTVQNLKDVKKFEIELASRCNARCPLCIRQLLGTDLLIRFKKDILH